MAAILSQMHSCLVSGKLFVSINLFGLFRRDKFESKISKFNRYLDQLGMASIYGTKTYCRQTLIGGNYGLLNTNTFVPNPGYYR